MVRSAWMLLAAACAGCTALAPAAPGDPEATWRRLQVELLLARNADGPAASSGSACPAPAECPAAPQEPRIRHLDQVEPALLGERAYAPPAADLRVGIRGGLGTVAFHAPGARLEDRAAAATVRVQIDADPDAPTGAGVWLRAAGSDGELFRGGLVSDGIEPQRAEAYWRDYGLFPHGRWRSTYGDRLVCDWRVGLDLDLMELDHRFADLQRRWLAGGLRVAAEPRWRLSGSADQRLDLVGSLGATAAAVRFEEVTRLGNDSDMAGGWSATAGLGLRYRFGPIAADVTYEFDASGFSRAGGEVFGQRRVGVAQQWLLIGFSVGF